MDKKKRTLTTSKRANLTQSLQPETPMKPPARPATATATSSSATLISDHREILDLMIPVLDEAQHVPHIQRTTKSTEIFKKMKAVRGQCDQKIFPRIVFRAYVPVFQSTEKSRFIENLLDFIYLLCVTLDKEESEQEGKVLNTFSHIILRCCTKHHLDERAMVRIHITQLAVKLLDSFPSINDLDQKLQDKVKDMLIHRAKDKNAQVRAYGAKGLKHFQLAGDPSKCQVTKVLSFHCQHDPNPEVRRAALGSLTLNDQTKDVILDRVMDVNELVRLSAETNLANKVSMDGITLDEREKILQVGLTDSSNKVKRRAGLLVETWLKSCDEDVILFLTKLDVVSNKKVCYLALDQIFKEPTTGSFKKVDLSLWGENKLIPMEKLTEEVAFYWKYVVEKFRKLAYCADFILPSTHDICNYILEYLEVYQVKFAENHGASVLEQLLYVLFITSEFSEEGGRREILACIQSAFDFHYLDVKHVKVLMALFYKLQVENVDQAFFQLIQDMLANSRKPKPNGPKSRTDMPEGPLTGIKKEMYDCILAKYRAGVAKEKAVLANDFLTAQNLQLEINKIEEKMNILHEIMNPKPPATPESLITGPRKFVPISPPRRRDGQYLFPQPGRVAEEEEEEKEEPPPKPTDYFPAALEIAFGAFLEHVRRQPKLSDSAQPFFDTFILPSIVNESERVRELVILIMGLVGLGNPTEAKKAMLVSLQALVYDQDKIRVTAYRVIFDLILHYGFDYFDDGKIQKVASERGRAVNLNNSVLDDGDPSLRMHVMDQLNSTNSDLVRVGATGLIKLTLAKRVASTKIVIRLLTMWSNPVYENSQLARDLSLWLPIYAKLGEEQAFHIADSLVPTMQKLIYAGRQSPLGDASPEKLVCFVTAATNLDAIEKCMKTPAAVHERMIQSVLNEMSNLAYGAELPIFAKTLKFFSVRGLGPQALESLLKKLTRIMQLTNNRALMQSLKAFHNYLNAELLLVADKQVTADDTASHDEQAEDSDSSLESVHISDSDDTPGGDEESPKSDDEPFVEKVKKK